jgi:hypothetical protein
MAISTPGDMEAVGDSDRAMKKRNASILTLLPLNVLRKALKTLRS